MIHTFGFTYSTKVSNFQQRKSFWVSFGKFVKNHLPNHSSKDNESDSFTDTIDDLDDIFDEFDGDFDEISIFETGYDADSEDDTD